MNPKFELPRFNELKTVHIIGVCGTLMGSFAAYLKRKGIRVTGSDQNIYPPMSDILKESGVELCNGFRSENLTITGNKPDLVVIGNVIGASNPEAKAAIEGGFVYSSLPEAMEKLLLKETKNLVVAGTHGKTTTSSILAHTLSKCQKNPNYFIGGVSHDLPFSFHLAGTDPGHCFVLEGDEYDTAFWDKVPKFNHYLPNDVILSSVEYDHADIYPNLEAVIKAFEGLVIRIRPHGKIIACFDYSTVKELVSKATVPVISYGRSLESGARFTPRNIQMTAEGTRFEVLDQGTKVDQLVIQIPGIHNVLNALAVWIECRELSLDMNQVREALRTFKGVKRRQEIRGEVGGVIVMDDFAHHPTAVRETLRALRLKYPQKRLVSIFEPRSATSRRKVFQKDYVEAFSEADLVFIASPFDQSKISEEDQFSSETLVEDLNRQGKQALLMGSVEDGVHTVANGSRSGDLIAVLSNGGFGGFISKLLQELKVIHSSEQS
jgi:UDP-N-acetylmuramate: L-alanyl-gamma-D-glutamyl-meso-diaminopimelate ligase